MKRVNLLRDERGQALVEFAIVAPLLLTLVLGIVQFGLVFSNSLALTDAVRAGARAAVVAGPSDASAAADTAVQDSAGGLDGGSIAVSVASTDTDVTVTATYPYAISIFGIVVKSGHLTSTTKERFE